MKTIQQWLFEDPHVYDRRSIIRIAKRVTYLFVIFNLLYYVVQPLEIGKPTLYNSVFPGRLRMAWAEIDSSTLLVSEAKIPRLLADHVISRPKKPDEYRIVVLGSSEIWGQLNRPQDTMPVILDQMDLNTPDGRQVYSYNLAYVQSNAFKDLMILRYALVRGHYQPDLVILFVNSYSFYAWTDSHPLFQDNAELALAISQQYDVKGVPLDPLIAEVDSIPWWRRHSFLAERDHIAYWLVNQVYGLAWTTADADRDVPESDSLPVMKAFEGEHPWTISYPDILQAYAELTHEYHVPILLVVSPVNYVAPAFNKWLPAQAKDLGIPLLDCSLLLPYSEFTDSNAHFTRYGHQLLAEQVAAWLQIWWSIPTSEKDMPIDCPVDG